MSNCITQFSLSSNRCIIICLPKFGCMKKREQKTLQMSRLNVWSDYMKVSNGNTNILEKSWKNTNSGQFLSVLICIQQGISLLKKCTIFLWNIWKILILLFRELMNIKLKIKNTICRREIDLIFKNMVFLFVIHS